MKNVIVGLIIIGLSLVGSYVTTNFVYSGLKNDLEKERRMGAVYSRQILLLTSYAATTNDPVFLDLSAQVCFTIADSICAINNIPLISQKYMRVD